MDTLLRKTKGLGLPYTYEIIALKDLAVDPRYQRDFHELHANRIAEAFNHLLFREPYVSRRSDGTLAVLDGQHEIWAAKRNNVEQAVCRVYDNLSFEDEAKLYSSLDSKRYNLSPMDLWKADSASGDKEATVIKNILSKYGLSVSKQDSPNTIAAITATRNIYDRFGADHLDRVAKFLVQTWPDDEKRTNGKILRAIAWFLFKAPQTKAVGFSDEKASAYLSNSSVEFLLNQASVIRARSGTDDSSTHSNAMREALRERYNKGNGSVLTGRYRIPPGFKVYTTGTSTK